METTEKIVEAYVRYVKGWATIPNIKCDGQAEIDLIAIDPRSGTRFHIESGISVSQAYSKLTAKPFVPANLKIRGKIAGTRRAVGYFAEHKFRKPAVIQKLREYGFEAGKYRRIIVTWGFDEAAKKAADLENIELWDFRTLVQEIANQFREQRSYFTDDTLRTIHLFVRSESDARNASGKTHPSAQPAAKPHLRGASIYDPLRNYLRQQTQSEIVLTFEEIEKILGRKLPPSAAKSQWWANTRSIRHSQREAWRLGGYDAFLIKGSDKVRFRTSRD